MAAEFERFADPTLVLALRSFLIAPRLELRTWEWTSEGAKFPTWVVAESPNYDYGIVYSENGFGPANPWGLIFSSQANFGADYCWYCSLEAAFLDSRLIEEHLERRNEA